MKYYTDPLQAAIMQRDFGVKLFARHSDEQMSEYDLTEDERDFDWSESCSMNYGTEIISIKEALQFIDDAVGKIYIHPDSLHIFEPQIGDLVTNIGMDAWFITAKEGEHLISIHEDRKMFTKINEATILQRNGKAFFTPEEQS